jgi:hypothetical protein
MQRIVTWSLTLALGAFAAGAALAKLPAPVLSDEAKAKAAEAAAKTAHGNKLADFQLCKSMERVAARYQADAKKAGKDVKPPTATPPCTDPGAFAFAAAASAPRPIEAAGAHSPTPTAASPPSTTVPAAVTTPTPAKAPASKG